MDDPTPTVDASSKPLMRFRRTRIAISTFFVVLTVLLCVLWARTKERIDYMSGPFFSTSSWGLTSRANGLGLALVQGSPTAWQFSSMPRQDVQLPYETALGFIEYSVAPTTFRVRFPYWFLVSFASTLAATLWIPLRYSLRTMLIATTLVAVVLGLGVWLVR